MKSCTLVSLDTLEGGSTLLLLRMRLGRGGGWGLLPGVLVILDTLEMGVDRVCCDGRGFISFVRYFCP